MLLSTLSIAGLGVGNLISGQILKNGRIKVVIACNIISLIATASSIWLNWELILASRFIFAICAGLCVSACPKMIEETIPAHLID